MDSFQTRSWNDDTGTKRYKTEVNIDEMILLARGRGRAPASEDKDQGIPEESSESEEDINLDELLEEIDSEDSKKDSN